MKNYLSNINMSYNQIIEALLTNPRLNGNTTADRPASPIAGQLYYDTTLKQPIYYDGTGWRSMDALSLLPSIHTHSNKEILDTITLAMLDKLNGIYTSQTFSGDVTGTLNLSNNTATALTIGNGKVTNAKLANMPAYTIKGNDKDATGVPVDLSVALVKAMIGLTGTQMTTPDTTVVGYLPTWGNTVGSALDAGIQVVPSLSGSNSIPTDKAVKDYCDGLITANDAMVFKGTIGTDGGVTALPTTGYRTGWTYRVVSAGTYAGHKCEIGDMIICVKSYASGASDSDWTVLQTNIDGAVISSETSTTDGQLALFSGTSGKVIKKSTITESQLTSLVGGTKVLVYTQTVTPTSNTNITITHNKNSSNVMVTVFDQTNTVVLIETEVTSANAVTLKPGIVPTNITSLRVLVVAFV